MVLPDGQAVLGPQTFLGDAGADRLRQPIVIEGVELHAPLDLAAHALAPWLGAEYAGAQAALRRIEPLALEFVGDRQHVGRRHRDDVRP